MNEKGSKYALEDIKIGQNFSFKLTITESMLNEFAKLSGDHSPLHMDDNYAKSSGFKQRLCHGYLLASFFSRLIGMYLPGSNSLCFSQSLKFISPCFTGDEILVKGEVLDKSIATRIITLKTTIINNSGKCIIEGQAKVLVRK